jgi:putative tricarboxylic transport membrane protein
MELKLREALDLSGGEVSGLFNEGLAIFVYVLIALAIVLPVVLGRLRRSPDSPELDRENEEVSR